MDLRVGYGEDIHRLVPNRKLVLSGTKIPFDLGLEGHSDADVVFHAVSDALLGALGLGDIGKYFPPNDPSIAGIDSLLIVKKCLAMVKERGYEVHNVDVSISAQEPKLAPFILEMKGNLALALEIKESQASIKAMTNEGLDAVGKGEAIKASAVLLLMKE
ncbi:MAG: 2-C-methyl-D-erythritol 2,4-cyclodiphosphate synthase [Bacilli bacterium]